MYMSETVGVAELRQNLSVYLRRIEKGERLIVTDRNRPVAEIGPVGRDGSSVDRLIAEGLAIPARRQRGFQPLVLDVPRNALSDAVIELRGDR
jgi:prevent-host-death family protein